MILQIILGAIMSYAGFYGHSPYSPILFVEGMIILNSGLLKTFGRRSISHL
jgi:hypothetical protein